MMDDHVVTEKIDAEERRRRLEYDLLITNEQNFEIEQQPCSPGKAPSVAEDGPERSKSLVENNNVSLKR